MRAKGTQPVSRGFMPKFHAHGPRMTNYVDMRRLRDAHGPGQANYLEGWSNRDAHGPGQANYLERWSNRDAAQARYPFLKRPRWRV